MTECTNICGRTIFILHQTILTRIVLDHMDDPAAPPVSTQATVAGVDDIGQLRYDWDNGSSLSVILIGFDCQSIDSVHVINTEEEAKITLNHFGKSQPKENAICPRCGQFMEGETMHHARSRYAEIMVCDVCGMQEALEMAGLIEKLPLMEWALVRRCVGEWAHLFDSYSEQ